MTTRPLATTRLLTRIRLAGLLTLLLGASFLGSCSIVVSDYYVEEVFDFGSGRKIVLLSDSFWEVSIPISYKVIDRGRVVVPISLVDFVDPVSETGFRAELGRDGSTAAIYLGDRSEPSIVHDFATDQSWAGAPGSDVVAHLESQIRRDTLFAKWAQQLIGASSVQPVPLTWSGGAKIGVCCSFPLLLMAVIPLWAQIAQGAILRQRVLQRRERPPLCEKCRYDLTGNVSGVCPECGTRVPHYIRRKLKAGHSAR